MIAPLVVAVALGVGNAPKETKLKPTAVFAGSHSAIRYETFSVIATEEGWQRLWKEHRGPGQDPEFTETDQDLEIDFGTHYVVVVLLGRGSDWCWITTRLRGDVVVIGFRAQRGYQTEGRPPATAEDPLPRTGPSEHEVAKEDAVAPYAFVVLPKPVRTVVIEEHVRPRLGEEHPVGEHRFLFPAPKSAK